ncbi:hypothetical protein ITP53_37915 [Nonomuraea sp. K274]|uniref:Uncharacterized protein n=1 Tax=Nonomuraea cypriaca TaxID=1187855 RepID=A0A931AER7_9ACTN|nr:hypothetical protein [Nonomuraea cypriaca]MBF8191381.1 hypothetical protein [Nonomuraea cypriaca]
MVVESGQASGLAVDLLSLGRVGAGERLDDGAVSDVVLAQIPYDCQRLPAPPDFTPAAIPSLQ